MKRRQNDALFYNLQVDQLPKKKPRHNMMITSDPMLVEPYNANVMRFARLEQLRAAYTELEPLEVSPFEMTEYNDINKFKEQYEHNQGIPHNITGP